MSLSVLINSAVKEAGLDDNQFGEAAQQAVITALKEPPLRREVWEASRYNSLEEITMADVHAVLDGLIKVLEGTDA